MKKIDDEWLRRRIRYHILNTGKQDAIEELEIILGEK